MSRLLLVQWRVTAGSAPQPLLSCSRCDGPRPFQHSGKFRLNASGKRLDAWLIYRCTHCGHTWNRSIFERRTVRSINAAILEALQSNDPALAQAVAFDTTGLQRVAETHSQGSVHKTVLSTQPGPWSQLEIMLRTETISAPRLDRLLAGELGLSRSRLQELAKAGRLCTPDGARRAMRQAAKDRMRVFLDLSDLPDGDAIACHASGPCRG